MSVWFHTRKRHDGRDVLSRRRGAWMQRGLGLVAAVPALLLCMGNRHLLHAAPGDPVGGEIQVNTYTTGSQYGAAVGPDGAGAFVVTWSSQGSGDDDASETSIQARLFNVAGEPVGGEIQVNTYTTSFQRNPVVGPDGAGGFVVVWRSAGGSGTDTLDTSIQAQRFDAAGMPVGAQFQVNTHTPSDQRFPAVGPDGAGGFVVVWESAGGSPTDGSGSSVQARRFDAAGMPAGAEFQVNTYTTGDQFGVALGPDGAGGFVVAWTSQGSSGTDTSDTSIQAQRFDAAGAPLGDELQVNTYTTGIQSGPAVGPDGGGGFVVLWASDGSVGTDTSASSVQGQRFDGAGAPVGGQFQVNTYTTGEQFLPSLAPDGAGGFVAVWRSDGSSGTDTSGTSVQAQRFDAAGAPVGGELQVNTYTALDQRGERARAVAPDGAGGFVVVWRSDGSSGTDTSGASVQAQRFAGSGAASTTTTTTPGGSTTTTTMPAGAEALDGRKLQVKTKGGRPEKARLVMVSKDGRVSIGRGNGSLDDPTLHGGRLTITSAGAVGGVFDLVGSWKYRGKPGGDKGYKWKAKGAPIRTIVVKNGKLVKIAGKGAGLGFDLSADPGPVRIELAIGEHRYCFEFAGDASSFDPSKRYRVRRSPAPATCP